jgi:predicted Zn-dependent peptidase
VFARARARLLGNLLISRQSNAARASRCGADVLYGRAPNNIAHHLKDIRALTPRRVRDAAARYLGTDDRWEVVLGPA